MVDVHSSDSSQPQPPPVPKTIRRSLPIAQLRRVLALVGLLVIGTTAAFTVFFVTSLYDSELRVIRNRLEIPAHSIAHGLGQIAGNADLTLQAVRAAIKDDVGLGDQAPALSQLLFDRAYARSGSQKIEIYDAAGKRIASSMADAAVALSVADLEFFKRQLAATSDQLLVSGLVRDSADGRNIIISRPIIDGSGVVRGAIANYVDADFVQRLFDSLPMPPGSDIVLFTKGGRHLLRSPSLARVDKVVNVDFSQRAPFRAFRDSGSQGAFLEFMALSDGTKRFVAGVGDPNSPFVVTVGWDVSSALAHWRRVAAGIIAAALLGIVTVSGLFVYILFALGRNEALLVEVSRSDEKFRALMAALPDAVMIIDQSLTINFANAAAAALYGYEVGEMIGLPLGRFMASATRSTHEQSTARALTDLTLRSGIQGQERLALRKDGTELPVEISATPFESAEGRMLVAVVRDVRERQAHDRALNRSRENLARAQRIASVGSFERDLVSGEVEWSEEYLRIWGIREKPAQDSFGLLMRLVHPEDRHKFVDAQEAILARRPYLMPDFRIIRPDGTERILHNEYSADYDADGKLVRLFGTVQDVTERKKSEIELRRSRETLARAQRVAGIGSFERNLLTGEIEYSDEFCRIHGIPRDSYPATLEFLHSLVHPEDRGKLAGFRRAAEAGTPTVPIDYRIIRPDGVERVLHRESDILRDEDGTPICLFGTLQDITERKVIELKLQQSRENLTRAQRLAGIGSFERDLVSGERTLSDEFKRIWGIDDIQSGNVRDVLTPLVYPEDRQKFKEMRDAAFQNRPTPSLDLRITHPNGEERIVHPEFRVIFDESGKPIRMFGTVQDVTERKKIELELRRSRERLTRAHRVAGLGSFERDLVTGEVAWSEEFLRVWGIAKKPRDGTAEFLASLVHPDDRQKFMEGRNAALGRAATLLLDFRIIRPDGEERVLHREYGVQFDENGKAVRMFGTVQDITDRKRIELEIDRSRENLARAQRIAGIGSFDHDLTADRSEWSDEMYRILGIAKIDAVSGYEAFISLVHPEDRARIETAITGEIEGARAGPLECRIVRPDGKERILRRESDVVLSEDGAPIRVFGTIQDITERKKAELALLRSRENLARAQRFAGMGSFERDLLTNQGEWSEEMFRILGLDRNGPVPNAAALMQLVHPDDRKKFRAYRAAEIGGAPSQPLEYRVLRPDGVIRIVRRESAVVFDEEKRAIGLYGTLQDITEQRLAERRERELERQLLHSQKLEALGTLAGGIAHDLNNTLVPIMALSKITARRFEAGSLVRTNLETIYEASERARDLVKRVLAFSRKDESEKRDTDIADIVDEALKLLRATIPSSIALETHVDKVPAIPADASQIHQIVTNLVTNAAQAIGSDIGTIVVRLELRQPATDQREICLSVSDTGMGIDKPTQQRIFEPFFTTKPVGQGTGLGLSIVHGIVSGHGGRIEVTSEPGEGTCFELYFPLAATVPAAAVTSSRPAA
jgi:PAS domain S-box-containing protein